MNSEASLVNKTSLEQEQRNKILIIVPCLNEEVALEKLLSELEDVDFTADILVVNDGSDDKTLDIVKGKNKPFLNCCCNLGIGGAMQAGFKYGVENSYDYCIQLDGDGQHPPSELKNFFKNNNGPPSDLLIGSGYKDGAFIRSSVVRFAGTKAIAVTLNILFPGHNITDPTSGFRCMNKTAIEFFANFYPHDYPEPVSIAWAIKRGLSVSEISVKLRTRVSGKSSISPFDGIVYMVRVITQILIARLT